MKRQINKKKKEHDIFTFNAFCSNAQCLPAECNKCFRILENMKISDNFGYEWMNITVTGSQ